MLGLQVWPEIHYKWSADYLGYVNWSNITNETHRHWMSLAGSASTFIVSILTLTLFYIKSWSGWRRDALFWLSLWWFDLLTYTLPVLGVRKYIIFGSYRTEPHDAAVALGVPSLVFIIFVFVSCPILLFLLLRRMRTLSP
ncbi:MAG: hypothetical protein ACKVS6_01340 [Planctomycetota bacterium]